MTSTGESRKALLTALGWRREGGGAELVALPELLRVTGDCGRILTVFSAMTVQAVAFETKVLMGSLVERVAEAYVALCERLGELGVVRPPRPVADPVDTAAGWPEFTAFLEDYIRPLRATVEAILSKTDTLLEWPTTRVLDEQVLRMIERCQLVVDALISALGARAFMRGTMGDRDERYQTFSETRDYLSRGDIASIAGNEPLARLVGQLRTQRDELDAVETFGRLLASEDLEPRSIRVLGRIVGDEARHALIGELELGELGFDPISIPVGTIGALCRRELDPWDALAQICLIGEVGNLGEIGAASKSAEQLGEDRLVGSLQAIRRDEQFHLRSVIAMLSEHFSGTTARQLQSRALEMTNTYLLSRGVESIDSVRMAHLLGE